MHVVDSHCHIISPNTDLFPRSPLGGKQSAWASDRPVTAEGLLALMDESGIDQAVLVQATTAYGYDNSYVIDSAQRWPDRFAAVGTFDPLATDAAGRLAKGIAEGLVGVRLFTTGSTMSEQGMWFAEESTDEFWTAASKARIPVCLQLRLGEDTRAALDLLLSRHPEATVLLDHCGYPDVVASPGAAAELVTSFAGAGGLNLKLTHRTLEGLQHLGPSAAADFLEPLFAKFGAERVAWGSNCPAADQPMSELVALARDVLGSYDDDTQAAVFGGTVSRLYSLA
ncbi:amidohydrolase family protein [Nocardioides sp. Kera G14]|uniref:amidohydrolase family protein n=1 Tax=Nocardioides sp. Kera G14 TaxID=2884264 RepID=UPI001D10861B|nr:amidohydrolase family protein [Nocardioides sp. Kera G14]UDY23934.1 amidohydrolase [Nocardioides sp. Kera G14]